MSRKKAFRCTAKLTASSQAPICVQRALPAGQSLSRMCSGCCAAPRRVDNQEQRGQQQHLRRVRRRRSSRGARRRTLARQRRAPRQLRR